MELRNCPRCGGVFPYISSPICQNCVKEEEAIFLKVRNYIKEHPNATILEVSTETEVSTKKIYGYLREGRIEAVNPEGFDLQCDRCGKMIAKGKYCNSCTEKISKEILSVFEDSKSENFNGGNQDFTCGKKTVMHTYKKINRS